jgi:uncharacterized protein
MKNILKNEVSPYLIQHKNNPVKWQTWTNESLMFAKKKKKPILLSIGYASCHWCHVMAHESFEDKETAEIMNKYFLNIKVDREERPDLDFVYQNAYSLFNNTGGGWPLTMFLDENSVPFFAGTYFPLKESNGLPSFKNILKKVGEIYSQQRDKIIVQAPLIKKGLELKKSSVLKQDLTGILEQTMKNLDENKGGFKGAPKFPTFYIFDTFLYFYNKTKKEKYFKPVELLLKQLCSKGIYDHVEGGISRYTVDEDWLVPHFEKMLYDNAQFVLLLTKYIKICPNDYFKNKALQTISFINKNFLNKDNNLLGSAYDADSEGEEGKYYIFNFDEVKDIEDIEKYFEISKEGNWEGKIILKEIATPTNKIIDLLYQIRKKKIKPFFDNKNQLDLNCLWVSSLVSAHKIMPEKGFLNTAEKLLENLEISFLKTGISHSNSKSHVFLEDYAYLINCHIDLFEETLNPKYKLKASELTKESIGIFYLKEKKIFQKNSLSSEDLFFKPIDISDHTISNGNSIMLINLTRLGFKKESQELADSLNGYLNIYKSFMLSSVKAIDYFNAISSGKDCNHDGCSI